MNIRALSVALLVIASVAPVARGGSLSLVPAPTSSDTVATGDLVTLEIHMDFTGEPIFGGGFSLLYDATSLGFVSFFRDESLGDPMFSRDPDVFEGLLADWAAGSFEGLPEVAVMGSVTFVVLATMDANTTLSLRPPGSIGCAWPAYPDASFCYDVDYGSLTLHRVPVPAAGWLLMSALGLFGAWGGGARLATRAIDAAFRPGR